MSNDWFDNDVVNGETEQQWLERIEREAARSTNERDIEDER